MPVTDSQPSTERTDFFVAVAVFLVVFAVYAATCCRTVYSGDSGDFVTAAATGGIPHPSGYPLFTLLARLWGTILPIGEWAFRVNLFVAASGAVAAAYIYRFLALLLDGKPAHRAAAVFGALCMAWGPVTWGQATISEVYTLGMSFLAALLFYCLRWVRTPEDGSGTADNRLAGLCFLYGLALTNHLTIAFVLPLFLVVVLWRKPSLFGKQARLLLPLAALFVLPLALYAYLPLAAKYSSAPVRWGMPVNMDSLVFHVSGRRYAEYMTPNSTIFNFSAAEYFGKFLPRELGWFLILAIPGVIGAIRDVRLRPMGLLLLGIYVVQTLYGLNYSTPDVDAYYLPSYLILACFIGIGAAVTVEYVSRRLSDSAPRVMRFASLLLIALPLLPLAANYGTVDKRLDRREYDYARNLLDSCPPNTVLFLSQDTAFTLWYQQYVNKIRPDVVVLQTDLFTGSDIAYWYGDALRRAYPAVASDLPASGTPPVGDAGMIRFLEAMMAKKHPVLFLPADNAIPPPARLQMLADVKMKAVSAIPEPKAPPSPKTAKATVPPATLGQWISTDCVPVMHGLCVQLYPRSNKAALPDLATTIKTNADLWRHYRLNGVFVDTWRTDDDPLHVSMQGRYITAITDFGRLTEQVGAKEIARDCYQKAVTIYPTPAAVEGLKRLGAAK